MTRWIAVGSALVSISATPTMVMVLGTAVALAWSPLSLTTLLWLDLYVLLAFVAVLGRFGRSLLRSPAVPDVVAASPSRGS